MALFFANMINNISIVEKLKDNKTDREELFVFLKHETDLDSLHKHVIFGL